MRNMTAFMTEKDNENLAFQYDEEMNNSSPIPKQLSSMVQSFIKIGATQNFPGNLLIIQKREFWIANDIVPKRWRQIDLEWK